MNQVLQYEAIVFTLFAAYVISAGEKTSVKIVNSTNIRELKLSVPDEDKTGAVAYVYAVESADFSSTEDSSSTISHSTISHEHTEASTKNSILRNEKMCVTRAIEKMKGDERIVNYIATAEEAKSAGKTVLNTVCEGDTGFDAISKSKLVDLNDDIYHSH